MRNTNAPNYAAFDLPVSGVDSRCIRMPNLLRAFLSATIQDPETAVKMGRQMAACHYPPGQLAYARFLRTTASISMPHAQRHQEAEAILLQMDQDLDLTPALEREIALELAALYNPARPVGALAALLRANRLGAAIPPDRIQRCRKAIVEHVDVNHLGDNPMDAYKLAVELDRLGNASQFTEVFYKLAFDGAAENSILKGAAALGLAELYGPNDARTAVGFYLAAEKCGFPDLVL